MEASLTSAIIFTAAVSGPPPARCSAGRILQSGTSNLRHNYRSNNFLISGILFAGAASLSSSRRYSSTSVWLEDHRRPYYSCQLELLSENAGSCLACECLATLRNSANPSIDLPVSLIIRLALHASLASCQHTSLLSYRARNI